MSGLRRQEERLAGETLCLNLLFCFVFLAIATIFPVGNSLSWYFSSGGANILVSFYHHKGDSINENISVFPSDTWEAWKSSLSSSQQEKCYMNWLSTTHFRSIRGLRLQSKLLNPPPKLERWENTKNQSLVEKPRNRNCHGSQYQSWKLLL